MNRQQIFELMKFIRAAYPNFAVEQTMIEHWARLLKDQNPAVMMRNAERYVLENKYPPSLSDLMVREYPAYSNEFLKKKKDWEREAVVLQSRR